MADVQILPSTRDSNSLAADPYTTRFGESATHVYPGHEYSDYGFIAVLGLAQRLKIQLLPITWQAPLGLVGRSRAEINQALVNVQTSFAFKRLPHTDQEDPLRETVQEMAILGHPLARSHPHLVSLIGICWDIPQDNEVWPVLVFEKTELGDLYQFARSDKGKDLSLEEKLKICVDVGIAIRDMHLNKIIHGDIKPQNVLISENEQGIYIAKLADFGFSTHFPGEQDLIKMPSSEPWTAPEHHLRWFSSQDAKAMDVYSFSMLCLWLLFGVDSPPIMPSPPELPVNEFQVLCFDIHDHPQHENLLLSWKRDEDEVLLEWALWLVALCENLAIKSQSNLTEFFKSSLCFDHQMRTIDWDRLLKFLAPNREFPKAEIFSEISSPKEEKFEMVPSIWALYHADFRLRAFITAQLEAIVSNTTTPIYKHTSKTNASSQLSLCYQIGFGVAKHEREERIHLFDDAQRGATEDQVRTIKESGPQNFHGEGLINELHVDGFVSAISFPQYYREKGLLRQAREVYEREVQDTKESLGNEHWLNLLLRRQLGIILEYEGQSKKAEEMEVEVMETRRRVFGDEDLDTLISMAHVANMYCEQGRCNEAEELFLHVTETNKRILGKEHPSTLLSISKLASTYRLQGRWDEAYELQVQVLETTKIVFGKEHLATLRSMSDLGMTYGTQGRWKEAEELQVQVAEVSNRMFGAEDRNTLNSMHNLSGTYRKRGRWMEAEELILQVVKTRKKLLGDEHPDIYHSLHSLAIIYRNQGQREKAEKLALHVLERNQRVLGKEHLYSVNSMDNLAGIYREQGRWNEAEELQVQVIEMEKKVLGEDHPNRLLSLGQLALIYLGQGQGAKAQELGLPIMEKCERVFGREHPMTLYGKSSVMLACIHQGQWKEAEEVGVQLVDAMKRVLGAQHPDTLTSMAQLASVYLNQGRRKEAEDLEAQVMETRMSMFSATEADSSSSRS